MKAAVIVMLLVLFATQPIAAQIDGLDQTHIAPPDPKAFQPVLLRISHIVWMRRACGDPPFDVSMIDGVISVDMHDSGGCGGFPVSPPRPHREVHLGSFPAGDYRVRLRASDGEIVQELPFIVDPLESANGAAPMTRPANFLSFSDLWFVPDEPGHGIFLSAPPDGRVFGGLLTHEAQGNADWLVFGDGEWLGCNRYRAGLARTEASPLFAPYVPEDYAIDVVGEIELIWAGEAGYCDFSGAWDRLRVIIRVGDDTVEKLMVRAFNPRS